MNKKEKKFQYMLSQLRQLDNGMSKVFEIGTRNINEVRELLKNEFPGTQTEVKRHGGVIIITKW